MSRCLPGGSLWASRKDSQTGLDSPEGGGGWVDVEHGCMLDVFGRLAPSSGPV